MARTYYIRNNDENLGPFTFEELKLHGCNGETPVWYEGLNAWTTVKEVPELSGLLKRTGPPPFVKANEDNADEKNGQFNSPPPFDSKKAENISAPEAPRAEPAAPNTQSTVSNTNPNQKFILLGIGAIILVAVIVRLVANNNNSAYDSPYVDSLQADSLRRAAAVAGTDPGSVANAEVSSPPAETYSGPDEVTLKNMEYRNNWSKYISASRSAYNYSAAGGISGLSIVVYNNTSYPINYIAVAVKYITVNGYIHKTETVSFYDITAGSKQALPAPDSERGTSVEYEITNIYAPKFRFCYDAGDLQGNGSINDPWKCLD